jgi:hypothetical protein
VNVHVSFTVKHPRCPAGSYNTIRLAVAYLFITLTFINMKRLTVMLAFSGLAITAMAQKPWNTDLNEILDPEQPMLGTLNDYPLDFYTKGIRQLTIEKDGQLNLHSYALPDDLRNEFKAKGGARWFLTIDESGNLAAARPALPDPELPCTPPTAAPWVMGGNSVSSGMSNTAGTCNGYDFILKSGNIQQVYMKPNVSSWGSGLIGFGPNNSNPLAQVDISSGTIAPGRPGIEHTRIYGDYNGTIETSGEMNLLYQDKLVIGTGTRGSMIPWINIDEFGNMGLGNGITSPGARLHAQGGDILAENSDLRTLNGNIRSERTSGTARVIIKSGNTPFDFNTDNQEAHIGAHIGIGVANIMNFRMWGTIPQAWVHSKPATGPHTNFNFAAPKIVANEIFVFTTGGWADYVFADDYKLPELNDVEAYYKTNKHLPEIPSAAEVEENGISVGDMNRLLLKKVEELTLYVVAQQKEIEKLKQK